MRWAECALLAAGLEIHKILIVLCTAKFEANPQILPDINFEANAENLCKNISFE